MEHISRRGFLGSLAGFSLASGLEVLGATGFAETGETANGEFVLVGTQTTGTSKGIYSYRLDPETGELRHVGLAAQSAMPTFLALSPDGKNVFAVNEIEEFRGAKSGSVSSFVLDREVGKLRPVNQVASGGGSPCNVAVDHTGKCVFVANYTGGSAASFKVQPGGGLSEIVSLLQYKGSGPNKERQDQPHAHRVTLSPDNKFLMVNDLGLDVIHIYKLDPETAVLTANDPPEWKARPGSGPRALQFHPNGRWAYCVTEMSSTVYVLHWDAQRGAFETVQEISLLPRHHHGPTGASDIVLDGAGRFAYAANRLTDFLASFTVSAEDGRLTLIERSSCGGKTPRHLALDRTGKWLLVANQLTDNIAIFGRNTETGRLAKAGKSFAISRPQCILFA